MFAKVLVVVVVVALLSAALLGVGFWIGRATSPSATNAGWFGSMMSGSGGITGGPGMMGGYGGMMGGWTNPGSGSATPLTVEEVKQAVNAYLLRLGDEDLVIDEIMVFSNNAYALIMDKTTDSGAFEVLEDPVSKSVFLEYGPAMMWNTQYGMMGGSTYGMMGGSGGMMGGSGMMGGVGAVPPGVSAVGVSPDQALQIAQGYLDQYTPGIKVGDKADTLPGYYTIDTVKDGKTFGMLSVNATTGQVWVHTWHGTFIEEAEVGS
ncbi:MAG: PepSY domain-containing protein [Actinomycetota bacterium]